MRIALTVLIFFAGLVPYCLISFFGGVDNLVYFSCVWVVFYLARKGPPLLYTIAAVLCGIALAFPLSTFLHTGLGQMYFYDSQLGAMVGDKANLAMTFWQVGYFTVLMVLARVLNKSHVKKQKSGLEVPTIDTSRGHS
jgi:hypothetical protein